ncbi:MAG: hemolysin III family protein [Deltaproteobacteria bacterium]|nr:hemolysin III family protein [Candidatus Tharpella sp.]
MADKARYSIREEIASSVTHGIGILLSLAALIIMLVYAVRYGTVSHIIGAAVFGCSLIITYTSSTLYHSFQKAKLKALFRTFDHISIFILIAATYTPLTLVNLRGPWGWSIFGTVWGLAFFGIVIESTSLRRFRLASILLYIGMGWIIIIALKPLLARVQTGGLILWLTGGLFYSLGCIFYAWRRLPYNHAIWHLFVLAGSASHFFAILYYVLPVKI